MLEQGFMVGTIRHRRYRPKPHQFTYKMYWSLLDLDRLEQTIAQNRGWSFERWNLLSFYRKDFHQNQSLLQQTKGQPVSNKLSIIETIKQQTGKEFNGKVWLLAHLRFLGFNFNSVCFYFCYQAEQLAFIVAEITNTPWGERHCYVLDCHGQARIDAELYQFDFEKAFHISPFLSMAMDYQWRFKVSPDYLRIHMVIKEQQSGDKFFDATFTAKLLPLSHKHSSRLILRRPLQPLKMIAGIYWQAFKLWCKRVPFYSHPKHSR